MFNFIKIFLTISLLVLLSGISAQELTGYKNLIFSGTYQNKNVVVHNPKGKNNLGFSVKQVKVNGITISSSVDKKVFEIDLSEYKLGDDIEIIFSYQEGFPPVIDNTKALMSDCKLEFASITIDSAYVMAFCAFNELQPKTFYIAQYRWNKWTTVGHVSGLGGAEKNCYKYHLELTSGENMFRVFQVGNTQTCKSKSITVESNPNYKSYTFDGYPQQHDNGIQFSAPTLYEIENPLGETVMKGYGSLVDLYDLDYGVYTIKFDNQVKTYWYLNKSHRIKM